jgi:hypothetical protein
MLRPARLARTHAETSAEQMGEMGLVVFNITRDIRGEARIVERAFGLGLSAITEVVQLVGECLELEAV